MTSTSSVEAGLIDLFPELWAVETEISGEEDLAHERKWFCCNFPGDREVRELSRKRITNKIYR